MNRILVVAEHAGGKLNAAVAKCVACAASIPDADVTVAVLAADGAEAAASAAGIKGVARVLLVQNPANEPALAAVLAPQLAKLAEGHGVVLGPSTTFGKDLMPRVAALLGAPQLSDIMAAESAMRFRRPVYAGNAIATVELPAGKPVVATVRVASFQPAPGGGSAAVEKRTVDVALPKHTRFVSVSAARTDRPDLQTAARVISGGRALGSAENFKLIQGLADKLGAAIGASRAAVDAGYAPNELQVGQTGKIIAPELYVAIGISGAIQHLTGIKDARTIVAINKDSEAPIFEVADIGLVGDLFSLVPEIEKLL
ncbi:MAG TPA: electron transfer flavoprotein subunit alpha/FixB family protein [Steroidobacteraceae bacterium]|jgi:electron transfer flavoprotein alpha subunit|nr:electron transfer flavoprotein subunit alpha/FixB family protein [Steroidobacteraceae bacterium]